LGKKLHLVGCATVCVKSEVMLTLIQAFLDYGSFDSCNFLFIAVYNILPFSTNLDLRGFLLVAIFLCVPKLTA
jgi:hypothetical protein